MGGPDLAGGELQERRGLQGDEEKEEEEKGRGRRHQDVTERKVSAHLCNGEGVTSHFQTRPSARDPDKGVCLPAHPQNFNICS